MQIPQIGFGTWQAPLDVTKNTVLCALQAGYKHIDCAHVYQNESAIGEAFDEFFKDHDRSQYWITTKLWNTNHKPENVKPQLEEQLKTLHLTYVDLFLIHWGVAFEHGDDLFPRNDDKTLQLEKGYGMMNTWQAMESLVELNLAKHIGVSNFRPVMINDLFSYCKIKPYCNQIEAHPLFQNEATIKYCLDNGLKVTAYSPLGGCYGDVQLLNQLVKDERLTQIADAHKKTVAQVILRWHMQRFPGGNYSIIPKSVDTVRIAANIAITDFILDVSEMDYIKSLEAGKRCCDPMTFWGIPYFE